MKGHSSAVYVCRFNEHFSQCLTGSADKTIILWAVVSARAGREVGLGCNGGEGK